MTVVVLIGLGVWLGGCSLAWGAIHVGLGSWGTRWPLDRSPPPADLVRVVVPARNESANIAACVRGVLASRRVDLELVVVDDQSEDDTADMARTTASGDPRCVVRRAPDRPSDWSGKAWACQSGAADCSRPWMVFLDADVRIDPDLLGALVATASRRPAELVSVFGSWELETFWERVAIPAIGWFIRGSVDMDRVNTGGPAAFANGQVLLVSTEAWRSWGGHGVVRSAVLDDVRLAEAARLHGARVALCWAPWAFRVRLYRGLAEIVSGYTKNLYEGMGRRPGVAVAAALAVFATSVAPAAMLPVLLWTGPGWAVAWCAVVVAAIVMFRARIEVRDGRSTVWGLTHPVGAAVLTWVIVASMLRRDVRWKGRAFTAGRVPSAQTPSTAEGEGVQRERAGDET